MKESLNTKMIEKLKTISLDEDWIERVMAARTTDEASQLLWEKGATVGQLRAAAQTGAVQSLDDGDLEAVTGGGLYGSCPQRYDYWLCDFSTCPAFSREATQTRCTNSWWAWKVGASQPINSTDTQD